MSLIPSECNKVLAKPLLRDRYSVQVDADFTRRSMRSPAKMDFWLAHAMNCFHHMARLSKYHDIGPDG